MTSSKSSPPPQLFLQRERAAVLAEAQTDDLIKEAPKPALDQSGQWQETGGEIQWIANDEHTDKQDDGKKKEEEEEELDLNKGTATAARSSVLFHEQQVHEHLPASQLCSTQGSTWRTASWRPTRHCCWAASVREAL